MTIKSSSRNYLLLTANREIKSASNKRKINHLQSRARVKRRNKREKMGTEILIIRKGNQKMVVTVKGREENNLKKNKINGRAVKIRVKPLRSRSNCTKNA